MEGLQSGSRYFLSLSRSVRDAELEDFRSTWGASSADEVFDGLVSRYSEPRRWYHNWQHVHECLSWSASYFQRQPNVKLERAVNLALYFHDVVYVPGAKDNEEASARLLQEQGAAAKLPADLLELACTFIRATAKGSRAAALGADLVCDIDRAVFAASPERYSLYVQGVRREFCNSSDLIFRWGRRSFVRGELSKVSIYQSDFFHRHLEVKARANLMSELDSARRTLGSA